MTINLVGVFVTVWWFICRYWND